MKQCDEFISIIKSEFPDDRLTYQKLVPTFHPESASEAAKFFQLANKHSQKIFITGYGNNVDPVGEPFVNMVSVRTDRLNKLIAIEPEDFYVVAGGGYPLRELNKQLAQHHLWLPHSGLPYVGSVGGAVAVGLNADYEQHDFPLKKYLIRAEIVTPQGEIITPGSVCFKSVSGYDITRIFAGSWGLLGLIVSASFRVMPVAGAIDYGGITQKEIDRDRFLKSFDKQNESTDSMYSRKIKAKFDPELVLPVV